MSWRVREGDQHNHIDGRTRVHHIHLFNGLTGGEHELQILMDGLPCPHCKRHFGDIQSVDPKAVIEAEIKMLNQKHEKLMDYASRHGIPIKTGPLSRTPNKIVRINK